MFSKSLRSILFLVVAASLLSLGYFHNNVLAQASTDRPFAGVNAPAFVIGPVYTQPVDPAGMFFQSSWLDPDGSDYDQYVWDNFTLQSDQSITEIDWVGGYDPAKFGSGGAVLDFSVKIFASIAAGIQPDVANPPLVQYQTGGKAGEVSIGMVGGKTMYAYTFSLPTPFPATAGVKYWVQIEAYQHGMPDWGMAGGTGGNGSYFRRTASPGGDIFYQIMPGDAAFTLLGTIPEKATPVITWANPADITFGTALSGTELNATASVAGTFVYSPAAGTVLNAGAGQILSVDFTPTDTANYNSVPGTTVSINVNKATPGITWANPADITFGTALSGTELNATASVAGTFVYSPAAGTVLNAGAGQILSVDFTPTDTANYNSVPGTTVSINVNKATPVITWANPADLTFGTVLSGTELNATASVAGTFVYSPAAGTVLNAGAGQILSVDFTPTDSTNYNSVLGTIVSINVNKATPVITWANPADITFGTALSGTELNATASVAGTFVYSPAAGTVLNAGAGQILSVDFTPTDSANYNSVLGTTVSINVNQATTTSTPGQVFGNSGFGMNWWRNEIFQFWIRYENGDSSPSGSLIYWDREAHLFLVATSFDQLVIDGSTAKFSGLAIVDGLKNVWFEVDVLDGSEHGSGDEFTIKIPSLVDYSAGRTLTGRNITIKIIRKATLTVTADNQTIPAGSADPAFTFVYSGFVNGETASVVTTAPTCGVSGPHAVAGTYDILCSGGTASNYTFSYVKGILTVTAVNSGPIFADVPFSYWANPYIERLYKAGIADGCTTVPLNYCPDAGVTRAQMAVFLLKGIHGSSYTPPPLGTSTGFTDVPVGYWAAAWIKQLAAEGITGGCGTGNYCPDAIVTRAQMAVFLLHAKYGSTYLPPAASGTAFSDVPLGSFADAWIEQLVLEGITSGCGAGTYCPDAGVTRAQMAVFLVRTFNLP